MTVETDFREAIETGLLPRSEFNMKALGYLNRKGSFSPGYARCLAKAIDNAKNPPEAEDLGDFTRVINLFDTAKAHLKWPKIRLADADDNPIVLSVAGERARRPGTINVTDGGPFGDNVWYGRITRDGEFEKSRAATSETVKALKDLAEDPARTAETYGKLHNECCFCARDLTDPRSVAAGYGPVCADHFGLTEEWKVGAGRYAA